MHNIIEVIKNDDKDLEIQPDVIFNRYDLQKEKEYDDLCIVSDGRKKRVQVSINSRVAEIGCFLMDITEDELKCLADHIFRQYNNVKCVKYKNALVHIGAFKENAQRYIDLPESEEDLHKRLTSKNRYNLKREKRLVNEGIGEYRLIHYKKEDVPDDVIGFYFEQKKKTHNYGYSASGRTYIEDQNISDIYVMRTDDIILAVAFSCEQCEGVYFENFSYNTDYPKYSLGSIMYDLYLAELISKEVKRVYLGSDLYDYKKHYSSIREMAYIGEIYRTRLLTELVGNTKRIYRFFYRRIKRIG